jgi:DNA-directed RNA polymerase specialized sigma24 family protein
MKPMPDTDSLTHWIVELKAGNVAAAQKLWEAYYARLVGLARKRLRGSRRRVTDEEDVALSAFDSFCRGAQQGRFPLLRDRQNLWPLLVRITVRKAADQIQHDNRAKRGGGRVRGESALVSPDRSSAAGWDQIPGEEPTPEFALQVAEECHRLLQLLKNDELRSVAVWKMEGYTNAEIAGKLGCVEGSVERKLRVIRASWSQK